MTLPPGNFLWDNTDHIDYHKVDGAAVQLVLSTVVEYDEMQWGTRSKVQPWVHSSFDLNLVSYDGNPGID